jgi:hypothetical protein
VELRRPEHVVLQQSEQDNMPNEHRLDSDTPVPRQPLKDLHPSKRPAPQSAPPILSEGLESPRSSDC